MKFLRAMALPVLLMGCTPFQPVPPEFELWSRPGASSLDVKQALLECGKPSPHPTVGTYKAAFDLKSLDSRTNKYFITDLCMEQAGFKPRGRWAKEYCAWERYKDIAACKPNADVPKPTVERRLNSWWCRIHTDYEFCRDRAVNPAACDRNDHKHLPPECLP
ncbi:hypothetical protein SR882_10910 [Guyparkeria halophila]|uniref:Lipoprotein n=1 Tax=Guyparkeria halophila TaxID=47960 RepID=A0ABZ0YVP7_9GAMM|nr:hypothetical protein [Guyparkeria halophila]WQH16255.1 hypothetical protein SR882_10910 [Guyparkeria halophila]